MTYRTKTMVFIVSTLICTPAFSDPTVISDQALDKLHAGWVSFGFASAVATGTNNSTYTSTGASSHSTPYRQGTAQAGYGVASAQGSSASTQAASGTVGGNINSITINSNSTPNRVGSITGSFSVFVGFAR